MYKMDTRILAVLLIIGVAGSFGAVEASQERTRRSAPVVADRSPIELLSRLQRDVAPKGENGSSPTTPGPSTAAATAAATQERTARTSSTPKSTEQTPAPATASAFASTSPTTTKPETQDSKSSTPANNNDDDAASLSGRSNFEDEPVAGHDASQGAQVNTATMYGTLPAMNLPAMNFNGMNLPPMSLPPMNFPAMNSFPVNSLPPLNSLPNGNGWGQSGANAYAGASAGSFAGAGSYGMPASDPYLQGRNSFPDTQPAANPAPSYNSAGSYSSPSGTGFYNPNPFAQNNFADPYSFQRMMEQHFQSLQAQFEAQQRAMWDATNSINGFPGMDPGFGARGGFPGNMNSGFDGRPNTAPGGPQSAHSIISLGPRGGFQAGAISPVAPGLDSRFAEEVPAPSGNSFGVFASSSSSSRTGPDGKQISHKSSTTGVNDNGKISFRTVED